MGLLPHNWVPIYKTVPDKPEEVAIIRGFIPKEDKIINDILEEVKSVSDKLPPYYHDKRSRTQKILCI